MIQGQLFHRLAKDFSRYKKDVSRTHQTHSQESLRNAVRLRCYTEITGALHNIEIVMGQKQAEEARPRNPAGQRERPRLQSPHPVLSYSA